MILSEFIYGERTEVKDKSDDTFEFASDSAFMWSPHQLGEALNIWYEFCQGRIRQWVGASIDPLSNNKSVEWKILHW